MLLGWEDSPVGKSACCTNLNQRIHVKSLVWLPRPVFPPAGRVWGEGQEIETEGLLDFINASLAEGMGAQWRASSVRDSDSSGLHTCAYTYACNMGTYMHIPCTHTSALYNKGYHALNTVKYF